MDVLTGGTGYGGEHRPGGCSFSIMRMSRKGQGQAHGVVGVGVMLALGSCARLETLQTGWCT